MQRTRDAHAVWRERAEQSSVTHAAWIVRACGEGRRAPMGVSAERAPPGEVRLDSPGTQCGRVNARSRIV
eukprot:1183158-Pleurochrysis_carterae.AAC.1